MFFEKTGRGPTLVLLHGWMTDRRCWAQTAPLLRHRYTLLAGDLPGHSGGCGSEATLARPGALADHLAGNTPKGAAWVGWSLGGLVAQTVAYRHPGHVRGLVCIASSPRFVEGDGWPHGMPQKTFDDFAGAFERDAQTMLRRFPALLAPAGDDETRARLEAVANGCREMSELQAGLAWLAAGDVRAQLQKSECPVAFIGGGRDMLVSAASLQAAARLAPRGRYREIPGAGHAPMVSHPETLAGILEQCIDWMAG